MPSLPAARQVFIASLHIDRLRAQVLIAVTKPAHS